LPSPSLPLQSARSYYTMPRPNKRTLASRKSCQQAAIAKRRRTVGASENWEIPARAPSEGELSSDSDPDEETTVSEPEDIGTDSEREEDGEEEEVIAEKDVALRYPAQPDRRWKAVEKSLPGNSKTTTGKKKQSKYYYKEREKQKEKEKEGLQHTYADISRFFIHPSSTHATDFTAAHPSFS